ncbi:hypothetical protein [Actibacterium lipolyticum]|uniref:Uncharacterized protein n=1 Tax=Actibacterium lipolyticum TaxID=1524263 RepID=A0A238JKJ0_9RHOB|nr:hypothetical protein [Actibacterium lipolyticum]SMX31188.1 hypothetical protein COL8621_00322 [Actibacterium lipolyticum]
MADEWIIEVLSDLRNFAQNNGLPHLASELENTVAVASQELCTGVGAGAAAGGGAGQHTKHHKKM